jgi:hypothetical protein
MFIRKLHFAITAVCLLFQAGITSQVHAMLPIGDDAKRSFYKNQEWIWKADYHPKITQQHAQVWTCTAPAPVLAFRAPLHLNCDEKVAFGFPNHPGNEVAFGFPNHPGNEVAFGFPNHPGNEIAFGFPNHPGNEVAFGFPNHPGSEVAIGWALTNEQDAASTRTRMPLC